MLTQKIVAGRVVKDMNETRIRIYFSNGKKRSFTLARDETRIGRGESNHIELRHPSISRRHCVIKRRSGKFYVSDLDSLNGTFIGETPAKNTLLRAGDQIRAGDLKFAFDDGTSGSNLRSCEVDIDEAEVVLPAGSVALDIENVVASIARDLNALLKITAKINAIYDIEELQNELLSEIFEVIPATQGAIILIDENRDFAEIVGLSRLGEAEHANVSRTIVNRVLEERTVVLANDIVSDTRESKPESLSVAGVSSLLCVPMILFEKLYGVIYLSTKAEDQRFDESHIRFMSAISSIASVAIENARNFSKLRSENAQLKAENSLRQKMIGESPAIKKVYGFIAKAAPTDATILIEGESGTGKELAARAIQANSLRSDRPFVVINCATLTENLLESELFGHEKGAFTGALARKKGKLEFADGGTVFLDEVGELPLSLQAKLLRVLQEREFERVGGTSGIEIDVRVVAATNRDLESEVEKGSFRRDLFYRLNVMKLRMPPLRERRGDIMLLADRFLLDHGKKNGRNMRGFSAKCKSMLLACDFPGNVRELENAVERAVILSSGDWITPEDLPEEMRPGAPGEHRGADTDVTHLQEGVRTKKKEMIIEAFQKANGSYVDTAKLLDVHPNYLHRLIRVLDIKGELKNL